MRKLIAFILTVLWAVLIAPPIALFLALCEFLKYWVGLTAKAWNATSKPKKRLK